MKRILVCLLILIHITSCNNPTKSRIEILTLNSKVFDNERKLRVYLPPEYDDNKTFKVLYLNDGQHLFGQDLDSNNDWRVQAITDSLIHLKKIDPLIIVGIDNIGMSQRGNEYLPWEDIYLSPPIPNPQGIKYPSFLVDEVMPLIAANFKVKEGVENTGIGGFSYGGLIAVYTAMNRPDDFGFLLAETPSLYVDNQKILLEAKNSKKGWPKKVYFGVGTNELALADCQEDNEDNKMAVNDIKLLDSIIRNQAPHSLTKVQITKCAIHSFEEASKRLPIALQFLLNEEEIR